MSARLLVAALLTCGCRAGKGVLTVISPMHKSASVHIRKLLLHAVDCIVDDNVANAFLPPQSQRPNYDDRPPHARCRRLGTGRGVWWSVAPFRHMETPPPATAT
jgi:hypothetical protein